MCSGQETFSKYCRRQGSASQIGMEVPARLSGLQRNRRDEACKVLGSASLNRDARASIVQRISQEMLICTETTCSPCDTGTALSAAASMRCALTDSGIG